MEIFNGKIEYFLKCAEEESLYRAAFKIGLSQPALSTAIKKLEEELGFALFDRSVNGIRLTIRGRTFYDEVSSHRAKLTEVLLPKVRGKEHQLLRLGCVGHIASKYFLNVLEQLKGKLPTVHLFTSTSLDCYEEVISGNLEFAFVAWSSEPSRLNFARIAKEPVAVIGLRKRFPLLHTVKAHQELKNYPWVDLPKPQRDWRKLLEFDQPGYIARDVRILRDIVLRGLAIGYLQLSMFDDAELKKLAIAPVPPFYDDPAIYCVFRKDLGKEAKVHMEKIVSTFKGMALPR